MFYLLQHETDSAEVTYCIRTIQNNTLNTRIMHICARQITSWAISQRAVPAAGRSPSREGPKVKSLCAGFWSGFFIVYFPTGVSIFFIWDSLLWFKGISLVKAWREERNCEVLCVPIIHNFFFFFVSRSDKVASKILKSQQGMNEPLP